MNNGIQIEIQKDLNAAESKEAKDFANKFLETYLKDGMKFKTNGGWYSYYRRGTLGQRLSRESGLYFRRASKNRRIYQIVRSSELKLCQGQTDSDTMTNTIVTKDGKYKRRYNTNTKEAEIGKGCACPKCSAQLKVTNTYKPMPVYAIIGDIKG